MILEKTNKAVTKPTIFEQTPVEPQKCFHKKNSTLKTKHLMIPQKTRTHKKRVLLIKRRNVRPQSRLGIKR